MKRIFNKGILVLTIILVAVGCSTDTFEGSSFFVEVSGSSSVSGLPGETLTLSVDLQATERIASLLANSDTVQVAVGELQSSGSYTFEIPTSADFGDQYSINFVLTDLAGNTDELRVSIGVGYNDLSFSEIGVIDLGNGEGAAEISAYSANDSLLFVVNNNDDDVLGTAKIDVVSLKDPTDPQIVGSLDLTSYGAANSVAVSLDQVAVAVQADSKQDNGSVLIYSLADLDSDPVVVEVGPLPDMLTFSPNNLYLLVANEGEPNDDYTNDPEGSVTIIDAKSTGILRTVTFADFNEQEASLEAEGLRVFGPDATLAQDLEPEYIAISADSETAYVTLQENNGVAVIDISSGGVSIVPLGFKDYTLAGNEIDVTDEDDEYSTADLTGLKIFGVYQPDAIAAFSVGGSEYIITANEGDSREYEGDPGFVGESRVADVTLDPTAFPNASELQEDTFLGRLKMMLDLGDTDSDGDYDEIYSYGARSFSIWNSSGELVFDSGNDLDLRASSAGLYADGRSDDKSIEPEGVVVGEIGSRMYAFVGLERVDAVAIYDVSTPSAPSFINIIETGDAPEGLVFIPAEESPSGAPLLVVSSEDDGTVRIYQ